MRRIALCAAAIVMVAGPAGAQAPRAAQASLRVGISSGGLADRRALLPARATVAGPRAALVRDTVRRGVSGAEVALGIAGSAAGMWGGAFAGLLVYDAQSGCNPDCDDAGLGAGVIGLVAGSIVGTAVGTQLGAKLEHRRPGSFGRRLLGGGVGFLAGLGAFALVGHDADIGADKALPLIAFPVAQGVVGALLGRAR